MTEQVEDTTDVTEDLSLSDVFIDEEETKIEVETEVKTEDSETEKGDNPEVEEETEKVETKTEEVEAPSTEQAGQMQALIAERRKRQEAENKLKEYESKKEVPDPIEDPEGYSDYIKAENSNSMNNVKLTMSRDIMMELNPEYLELEALFMGEMLGSTTGEDGTVSVKNQALRDELLNSDNPAKLVVNKAKEYREIQKFKDPKYAEKLEADLRVKILKELEAEVKPKDDKLKATDVPDLTTASASGKNTIEQEKEIDSIDDIFAD